MAKIKDEQLKQLQEQVNTINQNQFDALVSFCYN